MKWKYRFVEYEDGTVAIEHRPGWFPFWLHLEIKIVTRLQDARGRQRWESIPSAKGGLHHHLDREKAEKRVQILPVDVVIREALLDEN